MKKLSLMLMVMVLVVVPPRDFGDQILRYARSSLYNVSVGTRSVASDPDQVVKGRLQDEFLVDGPIAGESMEDYTGIVVAGEEIIKAYTHANTIVSLACGTLGPALARALFDSGEIQSLTRDYVTPFYRERSQQAVSWFREALGDLPWHVHKPEGAIFLWLWFDGLPISSQQLYERLKKRGVLIVPGHNFFVGIDDGWRHSQECIRVSYAQDSARVREGIRIIAEEVRSAYQGA